MPEPNDILSNLNDFLNTVDEEGELEQTLSLTRVEVEDIIDTLVDLQDEIAMAEDNAAYLETENESLIDELDTIRDELDKLQQGLSGL